MTLIKETMPGMPKFGIFLEKESLLPSLMTISFLSS